MLPLPQRSSSFLTSYFSLTPPSFKCPSNLISSPPFLPSLSLYNFSSTNPQLPTQFSFQTSSTFLSLTLSVLPLYLHFLTLQLVLHRDIIAVTLPTSTLFSPSFSSSPHYPSSITFLSLLLLCSNFSFLASSPYFPASSHSPYLCFPIPFCYSSISCFSCIVLWTYFSFGLLYSW